MRQSDVITFLGSTQAYGLADVQSVDRIDTHISVIFLAGEYAYKLKRAIRLPFVDFRSLTARHENCLKEIEVNEAGAPNLYIEVVPVTFQDGQLSLNGEGEVVDYVVKMHRFAQGQLFDSLCDAGQLDISAMEALTDHICTCYKKSAIDLELGGEDGIRRAFEGHYLAFDFCPPHVIDSEKVNILKERVKKALKDFGPLLGDRRQTGFVRHCHGDLHLRNICYHDDQIMLFDAIEFEPDFAVIDVMYDLSFLLMDLCHRGREDLANAVFNRYLGVTGDLTSLNLLGLFLSSRAAIRSHVNAVASQNQESDEARISWEEDSRVYLDEAIEFLGKEKPRLIAVGGLSGTGKSRLAKALAPTIGQRPGAYIARTDMIRKRLMGVSPNERLTEYAYSESVTKHTYNTLFVEIQFALHAGYSVIVDGVFAREEERSKLTDIARKMGVDFKGLWLEAPLDVLKSRVESRKNDPSDADSTVVDLQQNYDVGTLDWARLDASGAVEDIVSDARQIISK